MNTDLRLVVACSAVFTLAVLAAVSRAHAADAWAHSINGVIYKNGGTPNLFPRQGPDFGTQYGAIDFVNRQNGWAVGTGFSARPVVVKSINGGNTWTTIDTGLGLPNGAGLTDIQFTNSFTGREDLSNHRRRPKLVDANISRHRPI